MNNFSSISVGNRLVDDSFRKKSIDQEIHLAHSALSAGRYKQCLQSGNLEIPLANQRWTVIDDQEGISKLITKEFERDSKSDIAVKPSPTFHFQEI